MLQLHKSSQRGVANHGWLQSNHTFSFGHYYNPEQMGFGPLLVINEDRVQPGRGFGTHGHSDMEIITYVISGALEHKDSMDNGSVIRYGDVQRMSAGSGVTHSEFNHATDQRVHFLQIWIEPNVKGIPPSYEEKHFSEDDKRGQLRLIGSSDGRDGSVVIHQDTSLYAAILDGADSVQFDVVAGRTAYLHVVRGKLSVNGQILSSGDALKVTQADQLTLAQAEDAEVLLFDLPY